MKNQPRKIEFFESSTERLKKLFLSFDNAFRVLFNKHLRNFCKRVKIPNVVTVRRIEGYITFLRGIETDKSTITRHLLTVT